MDWYTTLGEIKGIIYVIDGKIFMVSFYVFTLFVRFLLLYLEKWKLLLDFVILSLKYFE